jgi:hypothetical protein
MQGFARASTQAPTINSHPTDRPFAGTHENARIRLRVERTPRSSLPGSWLFVLTCEQSLEIASGAQGVQVTVVGQQEASGG